jgi:hypothetical protein
MSRVTAEQYYEKLSRRLKSATADIEAGVNLVDVSPTSLAAAKADKWVNGIMEARSSGRWEKALLKVTLEEWKTKMKSKGIPRIATGIDGARAKVIDFAKQLLPFEDNLMAEVERMPDVTLEDSINRMGAWARGMAGFRRQ